MHESPADAERLIEEACTWENFKQALSHEFWDSV
jgi:hypothetical protein